MSSQSRCAISHLPAIIVGRCIGSILVGMGCVDNPISLVDGETRTSLLATQLLAIAALGRIPLSLTIRDTAMGRSEIGFHMEVKGMA